MSEPNYGKWRSIDTAPQDGREILFWDGSSCRLVTWLEHARNVLGKRQMDAAAGAASGRGTMSEDRPRIEPEQWLHAARCVAAIIGPSSAAAAALQRYDELRAAGHDTHITYDGRMWLVKEPGEAP